MKHFKLKDPGSAITHFIGMLMAMFAATPLILRAMRAPDTVHVISLSIFIVSMFCCMRQAQLITLLICLNARIKF